MAKVTSKLQVTIPKAIADRYGIEPGDQIEFEAAGEVIRVIPPGATRPTRLSLEERLRLFDASAARQRQRQKGRQVGASKRRDWSREELYDRGEPR